MKKFKLATSLAVVLLLLPVAATSAYASTATSSDVGVTTPDIFFSNSSLSTAPVVIQTPTAPGIDWGNVARDARTGIDIVGEINTAFQIVRFIGGLLG